MKFSIMDPATPPKQLGQGQKYEWVGVKNPKLFSANTQDVFVPYLTRSEFFFVLSSIKDEQRIEHLLNNLVKLASKDFKITELNEPKLDAIVLNSTCLMHSFAQQKK